MGSAIGRRPPAMAIGLTDHVWTWEEFLTFSIITTKEGDYQELFRTAQEQSIVPDLHLVARSIPLQRC